MVAIWLLYVRYSTNINDGGVLFLGRQILTGFGAFDDHQGSQGKGS
jgi:hypothetical protein